LQIPFYLNYALTCTSPSITCTLAQASRKQCISPRVQDLRHIPKSVTAVHSVPPRDIGHVHSFEPPTSLICTPIPNCFSHISRTSQNAHLTHRIYYTFKFCFLRSFWHCGGVGLENAIWCSCAQPKQLLSYDQRFALRPKSHAGCRQILSLEFKLNCKS
jgi:hypothetical protein